MGLLPISPFITYVVSDYRREGPVRQFSFVEAATTGLMQPTISSTTCSAGKLPADDALAEMWICLTRAVFLSRWP